MNKRLIHQTEALNWLVRKCSDDFVRAWIIDNRNSMIRAGGVPEDEDMAIFNIDNEKGKLE